MKHFASSQAHLLAELRRIDILVQAQVERARGEQHVAPEFQGLYIPEREVDSLLGGPQGLPAWAATPLPHAAQDALQAARKEIARGVRGSRRRGIVLRLPELQSTFELTDVEMEILLIALAPEIDLRYERLYAYLQDDVTRKRPSADLALNLLCESLERKLEGRALLDAGAPLFVHGLLMSQDESGNAAAPGLNRFLKADEGLAGYLIGHDHPDPRLAAVAAWSSSRTTFEELLLPDGVPESLRRLTQETAIVHLYGPPGSGRKSAAQAMCTERGARLLVADVAALLASDPFGSHLRTVLREARLRRAVLLFDGFDAVLEDSHRAQYQALCRELRNRRGITVLAGTRKWAPPGELLEGCFAQLEFAIPPFETRIELWRRFSGRESGHESLAAQFRFTPGQIRETVLLARSTAEERTEDREVTTADLEEAARSRSNTKLAELAVRIEPRFGWDDIVLPPDRIRQLRELCDAAKHRARVSESWGFSRKLHATGINVLFSGPSGTGKTMAAEVMAGDLGLDLYKIDLSTVVSKYIGETEKNLSRIFHEAETSNAILFFDEADALFGKRTEIQDAHDRYANIETNYLLQKMEAHEGLAILATNLHKNLDEAFTRRVHGMVEFAMPGEGDRLRIWRNIWPAEAPLDSEVDLEFMARRFEVTGGNIRNIALAAAFLASAEGAAVGMRHLVKATRREYQKMRTVVGADHFGEYAVYARP